MPEGEYLLTTLTFNDYTDSEKCIVDAVVSGPPGQGSYQLEYGSCVDFQCCEPGCTDPQACNYDPYAGEDDASCEYTFDCNGVGGGTAVEDDCGECDSDPFNDNQCFFNGPLNVSATGGDGEIAVSWDPPNWNQTRNLATLTITNVESDYIEISMTNDEPVYGIQFVIQSSDSSSVFLNALGGSAEEVGINFQNNDEGLFIGFDQQGNFIPAGSGVLTYIFWQNGGSYQLLYLNDVVISGSEGSEIEYHPGSPFCFGECDPLLDFNIYREGEFLVSVSGVTEYADGNLEPNISHCYAVTVTFNDYESNPSEEACATTFFYDCAGIIQGNATLDECGECCGGTTEVECSYWNSPEDFGGAMDCNGDCSGTAWINECGCVEGETGYSLEFCYGCTDPEAGNYDPDAILECNGDNSCCDYTVNISLNSPDYENSTISVLINSPVDISDYFIEFQSMNIISASNGLSETYGYEISLTEHTLSGTAPTEGGIPADEGILTILTIDNPVNIYFEILQAEILDESGNPLTVQVGPLFLWQPPIDTVVCDSLGLEMDCNGICFEPELLGYLSDGLCNDDSISVDLFCGIWNFDDGDCTGQPLIYLGGVTSESDGWISISSPVFVGPPGVGNLTVQIGPEFIVGNGSNDQAPDQFQYVDWDVYLSVTDFQDGMIEISMNNTTSVAGLQFNVISSFSDLVIYGSGGGSASDSGFQIYTSEGGTVLGFTFGTNSIDENQENCDEGELTDCNGNCFPGSYLSFLGDGYCDDGSGDLLNLNCYRLNFDGDDCLDQDCNGTPGGDAYVDDCGICDENPENDNSTCTGCMDETASNFDETALFQCDACCEYNIGQSILLSDFAWNSISLNILPISPVVTDIFSPEFTLVVRNDASQYFVPSVNVNTIGNLQVGDGYEIFLSIQNEMELNIEGSQIDPSDYPIYLQPLQWNHIGYLPDAPQPIAEIMETLPVLITKDSDGNYFVPSLNINSIDESGGMKPGKGYQVFLTGNIPATLIYSSSILSREFPYDDHIVESAISNLEYFDIQPTGLPHPIIITDLPAEIESGDEIAIISGSEVVGAVHLINKQLPVVLTAWRGWSDFDINLPGWSPGEEIRFEYWDSDAGMTKEIYSNSIVELFDNESITMVRLIGVDRNPIPNSLHLDPPYPNPFNPTTIISYGLPEDSLVRIIIYDLNGRLVVELVNETQSAGTYHIRWDATDSVSGMYLVKMLAGEYQNVQKVILVK